MQLQKLVYFSHAWHLALKQRALSAERVQAWRWGPVFPRLYHAVKKWGNGPVMERIEAFLPSNSQRSGRWEKLRIPETDTFAHLLIERVWEVYGDKSGLELSEITHQQEGPWQVTRE